MGDGYETVIGVEVHVELATKTKIFCGCSTAFGAAPNTNICPVCTGQPGALPVLNKKAVEYAVAVGLAVGCKINRRSAFDRKNYFYPDNPRNYQITQLYEPVCRDGALAVQTEGGKKQVRIREIHLEEDAGKLVHDDRAKLSVVDFNRSGVPLIEIVSEPDMRSAEETVAFLGLLRQTIQYLGASDCRLNEGSMRVDVNLSVRRAGADTFGTRTEMKNLNSFRAVARAVESERERQIGLLEAGKCVVQETRRWDDAGGRSFVMRAKEDAGDYRYFPEPDLVDLIISDDWIREIGKKQPEFRTERAKRLVKEYGIPEYDAEIITDSRHMADLFEAVCALGSPPKKVSNWLMGETMRLLKERGMEPEDIRFSPEHLSALIAMAERGEINGGVAKTVFAAVFDGDVDPAAYVAGKGLASVSDEDALSAVIRQVLADNPQSVKDYLGGKERALGFLVGQTMKATKGRADPALVNALLLSLMK